MLDLTDVDFMDSVGLGVVLKAASRFHRQDKQLVLVVPPEGNVARLMDLAGVRGRFAITQTREEALALASAQR